MKRTMPARRPNLTRSTVEIGFIAAVFVCGWFNEPRLAGLVVFAMLAYWGWTRRSALASLRGGRWAMQAGVAIAVTIIVLAAAYWLGLAARDAFT